MSLIRITLVLVFIQLTSSGFSQKEKSESPLFTPSIQVSLLNGAHSTGNKFYFKSAFGGAFRLSYKQKENRIFPSLTIGAERFNNETLLPIGLEYTIHLNPKKSSGFLVVGGGYAFAFKDEAEALAGYDYLGGLFFNPGWGYRWALPNLSELFVSVRYRQQFLSIEYEQNGEDLFTDRYQYLLLQFATGINF